MRKLVQEKKRAIYLRKSGYSYNEILADIDVAKSTLSLWLKDLPLTDDEKKILKKRNRQNISLGRIRANAANKKRKNEFNKKLFNDSLKEFHLYKKETLFHTGLSLYWAEGAKRKSMCQFTNSDIDMVRVFIIWLETYSSYTRDKLHYRLYIHAPYAYENLEKWWKESLKLPNDCFKKTVIKPTGLGVKKRPNYKGCLRVEVPKSTSLLLKIKFWINMCIEYHGKQ